MKSVNRCSFLLNTYRDYILVQRCRRQKCKVKVDFGMVGTPEVFIIFQIVAVVLVSLSWGAVVFASFFKKKIIALSLLSFQ